MEQRSPVRVLAQRWREMTEIRKKEYSTRCTEVWTYTKVYKRLKMTSLNVLNVTCTLAHFALLFTFTSGLWIGHFFFSFLVLLAWIFCHKSRAITLWIWFKEFSFNRTKKHLCTKMWYDYRIYISYFRWRSSMQSGSMNTSRLVSRRTAMTKLMSAQFFFLQLALCF